MELNNFQQIIDNTLNDIKNIEDLGQIASYIPELSHIDESKLGIHLTTVNNEHFACGDSNESFSIQSISKVISLVLAFELLGNKLWSRVGVEPSGSSFNSLVQLEYEKGIPRNPFLNAGAIVICDVLVSHLDDPKQHILDFVRRLSGNSTLTYNTSVAESERKTRYRNNSLANLMKEFGNIHNDIDTVLDVYFHLCSIEMTCKELAQTFLFLAMNGKNLLTNAVMQLCGFYDEAGEFSFKVGLPGKSGVGGGIIAIHPNQYSVAVWSPKLNKKGNSYKGIKILEVITTETGSSIF